MELQPMHARLVAFGPGESQITYTSWSGTKVTATRTDKISPHDFAVGLIIPGREEFFPTHVRLLFDLYLKRLRAPQEVLELFYALEQVYNGEDPEELAPPLKGLTFPMQLDAADTNLYYTQLLMIQQDLNYSPPYGIKESKLDPPREFLMRFIRWVASGNDEIDKIVTNAVRNWPPPTKYGTPIQPPFQSL